MLAAYPLAAQSADDVRAFHDRAAGAIRELSSRPLTPGDTFLTWNPKPGGLIHTISVTASSVRASLLRGDGMIGTADVRWGGGCPTGFDVEWTTRDSVTGKAQLDLESHGTIVRDTLRVSGSKPAAFPLPAGLWAVADFGMEEALIPILRAMAPTTGWQTVAVFRPWHGRWDSVSVAVHDTAGVRVVESRAVVAFGDGKQSYELMILNPRGDLLSIVRFDQPNERRPMEGTMRYEEYRARLPFLEVLAKRYAPPPTTRP